jgi:hypothetical protein
VSARSCAGNPCGARSPPFPAPRNPDLEIILTIFDLEILAISRSRSIMVQTTARRVRHTHRPTESERQNAAAALQRALDRRDNGGSTGH